MILSLADKVLAAIKSGEIQRFYLIGGCDGAELGRNYYTQVGGAIPRAVGHLDLWAAANTVSATTTTERWQAFLAVNCSTLGQCNDAYGAVQVAVGLANALNCGVNDLPLEIVLSWFEQKAVAVLLTLLALDVKGIRVGPVPPAFITPNIFKVLAGEVRLEADRIRAARRIDPARRVVASPPGNSVLNPRACPRSLFAIGIHSTSL